MDSFLLRKPPMLWIHLPQYPKAIRYPQHDPTNEPQIFAVLCRTSQDPARTPPFLPASEMRPPRQSNPDSPSLSFLFPCPVSRFPLCLIPLPCRLSSVQSHFQPTPSPRRAFLPCPSIRLSTPSIPPPSFRQCRSIPHVRSARVHPSSLWHSPFYPSVP